VKTPSDRDNSEHAAAGALAQWVAIESSLSPELRETIRDAGVRDCIGHFDECQIRTASDNFAGWREQYQTAVSGTTVYPDAALENLATTIWKDLEPARYDPAAIKPVGGFNRDIQTSNVFAGVEGVVESALRSLHARDWNRRVVSMSASVVAAGELGLYGLLPAGSALVPGLSSMRGVGYDVGGAREFAKIMENSALSAVDMAGEAIDQEQSLIKLLGKSKATMALAPVFARCRGPIALRDLAEKAGVSYNSASTFVDRLTAHGLAKSAGESANGAKVVTSVPANEIYASSRLKEPNQRRSAAAVLSMMMGRAGNSAALPAGPVKQERSQSR
jgi:hypothetical protein